MCPIRKTDEFAAILRSPIPRAILLQASKKTVKTQTNLGFISPWLVDGPTICSGWKKRIFESPVQRELSPRAAPHWPVCSTQRTSGEGKELHGKPGKRQKDPLLQRSHIQSINYCGF
jgi:hypothetical protein